MTQELTRRFVDAGFVICGKTNTPELGILPTTEPRRFGAIAQPVEHGALDRRVLGRLGRGRGLGHGAGRARQRRRRVHPDPGLVLRPGRAQADPRPQFAGAPVRRPDGRARVRARRHPLGARLGGHPRRHRRAGARRPLLGAAASRALVRRGGRHGADDAAHRRDDRVADGQRRAPRLRGGGAGGGHAVRVAGPPGRGGGARRRRRRLRRPTSSTSGRPATRGRSPTGSTAWGAPPPRTRWSH